MSYVYDVGSRALAIIERHVPLKDYDLAMRFRLLWEEMHEANHRLKDAINHDPAVRKKAQALDPLTTEAEKRG